MVLTNLADGENKFYLHFELKDLDYAQELFSQMVETLTDLKNQQSVKILLSCTGGMTTSFFAQKLNDAVKLLSLDYEFAAVPFHRLYNVGFDYSAILLAPQIAYEFGLDPSNVIDYDFDDATANTKQYISDVMTALANAGAATGDETRFQVK